MAAGCQPSNITFNRNHANASLFHHNKLPVMIFFFRYRSVLDGILKTQGTDLSEGLKVFVEASKYTCAH
jgi:hypothetical protein